MFGHQFYLYGIQKISQRSHQTQTFQIENDINKTRKRGDSCGYNN